MSATNAAFGDLTVKDDELNRQWTALFGLLNSLLSSPPEQRDETALQALQKEVDTLRAAREASRKEIQKRFPRYAELVNPKTPGLDDIKATLRGGEAFVSFYFGRFQSYAWVVPKSGRAHLRARAYQPEGARGPRGEAARPG